MNMNDIYEYLKKEHVGEENAVFSKELENYLCSFRWFWDFVASSAPNRRHFSGIFPEKKKECPYPAHDLFRLPVLSVMGFSVRNRSGHRTEAVPGFPLFGRNFSVLSCSFG